MRIVLDTSALIRFFTNDIPHKANKIKRLFESDTVLHIPDVVFPELEYVLQNETYKTSRDKISLAFQFLVSKQNTSISTAASRAAEFYEQSNLDMADCMIIAEALSDFEFDLLSFDEKMNKLYSKLKT